MVKPLQWTFLPKVIVIEVVGTTKGKGFQGVVKRHGFSGVGGQSHGQHDGQELLVLLVTHPMPAVYLKVCVWVVVWVRIGLQ